MSHLVNSWKTIFFLSYRRMLSDAAVLTSAGWFIQMCAYATRVKAFNSLSSAFRGKGFNSHQGFSCTLWIKEPTKCTCIMFRFSNRWDILASFNCNTFGRWVGNYRYLSCRSDCTIAATCLHQVCVCVCRGYTVAEVIHQSRGGLVLKGPVLSCFDWSMQEIGRGLERGMSFSAPAMANYIRGGLWVMQ